MPEKEKVAFLLTNSLQNTWRCWENQSQRSFCLRCLEKERVSERKMDGWFSRKAHILARMGDIQEKRKEEQVEYETN